MEQDQHIDAATLEQGGNAVLEVLQQMATYDAVEHESKLASLIEEHSGNVVQALIALLEAQGKGQDLCITVQALGNLHRAGGAYNSADYDIDTPRTTAEHQAVQNAQAFATALARALSGILTRAEHGTTEAL